MISGRGKTVSKPLPLKPLELPLSEKQTPRIVGNIRKREELKEALEHSGLRVKQAL